MARFKIKPYSNTPGSGDERSIRRAIDHSDVRKVGIELPPLAAGVWVPDRTLLESLALFTQEQKKEVVVLLPSDAIEIMEAHSLVRVLGDRLTAVANAGAASHPFRIFVHMEIKLLQREESRAASGWKKAALQSDLAFLRWLRASERYATVEDALRAAGEAKLRVEAAMLAIVRQTSPDLLIVYSYLTGNVPGYVNGRN